MELRSFILLLTVLAGMGCSGDVSREKQENSGRIKEHLVNANKIFVEKEAEQIAAYQERHKLTMSITGTGLRYVIFRKSAGEIYPVPGDTVELNYQVWLLDGTPCYDTKNSTESFTLGKAQMPRGMEEAVEMMQAGDSSVIIIPSHLGYGFTGDGDKIPGNAATICYMSLKKIYKPS